MYNPFSEFQNSPETCNSYPTTQAIKSQRHFKEFPYLMWNLMLIGNFYISLVQRLKKKLKYWKIVVWQFS